MLSMAIAALTRRHPNSTLTGAHLPKRPLDGRYGAWELARLYPGLGAIALLQRRLLELRAERCSSYQRCREYAARWAERRLAFPRSDDNIVSSRQSELMSGFKARRTREAVVYLGLKHDSWTAPTTSRSCALAAGTYSMPRRAQNCRRWPSGC